MTVGWDTFNVSSRFLNKNNLQQNSSHLDNGVLSRIQFVYKFYCLHIKIHFLISFVWKLFSYRYDAELIKM